MAALLRDVLRELNELRGDEPALRSSRNANIEALTYLRDATEALLQQAGENPARAYAVSVPYLQLAGRVLGGALLARSAAIATQRLAAATSERAASDVANPSAATASRDFYRAKLQSARFYAEHLLPEALSLLRIVKGGGASVADAAPGLI